MEEIQGRAVKRVVNEQVVVILLTRGMREQVTLMERRSPNTRGLQERGSKAPGGEERWQGTHEPAPVK